MTHILALTINGTPIPVPSGVSNLNANVGALGVTLFSNILTILYIVASLLCLFYIIYGGISWVMSQGDKKAIEGARNTIIYAVIGLGVVFLSIVVIRLLGIFFNYSFLMGTTP